MFSPFMATSLTVASLNISANTGLRADKLMLNYQFGINLLQVHNTYMNLCTFHLCSLRVRTASENIGDFNSDDKRPAWCEGVTLMVGFSSPARKSISNNREMVNKYCLRARLFWYVISCIALSMI